MITWSQISAVGDVIHEKHQTPLFVIGHEEVSRQIAGRAATTWKTKGRMWSWLDDSYVYMKCPVENLKILPMLNPGRVGTLLVVSERLSQDLANTPGRLEAVSGCLTPQGVAILIGGRGGLEIPDRIAGRRLFRKNLYGLTVLILTPASFPEPEVRSGTRPEVTLDSWGFCDCGVAAVCGDPSTGEVWCERCSNKGKNQII